MTKGLAVAGSGVWIVKGPVRSWRFLKTVQSTRWLPWDTGVRNRKFTTAMKRSNTRERMANTTFPSDRLKRSSTGTMAKRIDLRCKIVLLGTLFFLVLPGLQGFANPETDNPDFRASQVETAWSRNGYNIQSEDETLFVVLAFEYQNLVSLVPSQNKLIVFSK